MPKSIQEQLQGFAKLCGHSPHSPFFPSINQIKEINAYLYLSKEDPRVKINLTEDLQNILKKEQLEFNSFISIRPQWQGRPITQKKKKRGDRWKDRDKMNKRLMTIFDSLSNKQTVAILGSGCESDKLQNMIEEGIRHIKGLKKLGLLGTDAIRLVEDRGLSPIFTEMINEPDTSLEDLGKILNKFKMDVYSENWTRKLKKIRGEQEEKTRYFYHNDFKVSKISNGRKDDKYSINIELALLAYRCSIEYFCERMPQLKFIVVAGYKPEIFKVATFMCGMALLHNPNIKIIILRRESRKYPILESWINTALSSIKEHFSIIEKFVPLDKKIKDAIDEKIKDRIVHFSINETPAAIRRKIKREIADQNK